MNASRNGHDLLGDRQVPADVYYGVHTLRAAVENSIGLVTVLNPYIGYANATNVAQESLLAIRSISIRL